METCADAIGLWMVGFGPRMINVVQRRVELVIVVLRLTAIFSTAVGQNAVTPILRSVKNGSTWPSSKSADVIGVLVLYSLAAAHLE